MRCSRSVLIRVLLFCLVCLMGAGGLGVVLVRADAATGAADAKARLWAEDGLLPEVAIAKRSALAATQEGQALSAPDTYFDASRLAFQSFRDGNWEIYATRGDGSQPVRLTNGNEPDLRPRFNYDASRIVFSSRRDGNYELYTMNADGSNISRLTYTPEDESAPAWALDGKRIAFARITSAGRDIFSMDANGGNEMRLTFVGVNSAPTWSPDGNQIAWLRRKDASSSFLMVMNADGNEPRTLTTALRYLQNPVWSPLGDQLAFDCDIDGDQWNEIVTLTLISGALVRIYDLGANMTDAWMGSWSPTGQHLVFAAVGYTLQDNQLFISSGRLLLLQPGAGVANLPGSGIDLAPDWQASDRQAPISTLQALPPESPGPISLQWSGVDSGDAGLDTYDVQVQKGASDWTDWMMATTRTLASYEAIGGETVAFRLRARDTVGNLEPWPADYDAITIVEAQPPVSQMAALPEWSPQVVLLRWQGSDPGGSGLRGYWLDYRDLAGGEWQAVRRGDLMTSYSLTGEPGHHYGYRVSGFDNAQNIEPWPAAPAGDTTTRIYALKVAGQIMNNNGAPLSSATISATAPVSVETDGEGGEAYAGYFLNDSPPYSITWSHPGYGSLPAANFARNETVDLDIVLPPRDDIIQNGDFEQADSLSPWLGYGAAHPTTTTFAHTGDQAALFGSDGVFLPPVNPWSGDLPQIVRSNDGIVHMVRILEWQQPSELYHIQRQLDGSWSAPYNFSNTETGSDNFQMAVGADGVLHVVWQEAINFVTFGRIYYARRYPDGRWLAAQPIPAPADENQGEHPQVTVDGNGDAHIVWSGVNMHDTVRYVRVDRSGNWSAIENVKAPNPWTEQPLVTGLAADSLGNIHIAWYTYSGGTSRLYYRMRYANGDWTAIQTFGDTPSYDQYTPQIALDGRNGAHLIWQSQDPSCLSPCYSSKSPEGVWSQPETLGGSLASNHYPRLAVDGLNTVHALWEQEAKVVLYASRRDGQPWSKPIVLDGGRPDRKQNLQLAVAANGVVAATWEEVQSYRRILFFTRFLPGRGWERDRPVADWADRSASSDLIIEANGAPHLVWVEQPSGSRRIYYAGPALATQAASPRLSQAVTLPASLSDPALSFFYRFDQTYPGNESAFDVRLRSDIGVTTLFSTTTSTNDWSHRWFDLSSWAGQTITVSFGLRQPADGPAVWAYVDDVSMGSSTYPDLYASAPPSQIALPGQPITLTIAFGNQGDGLAREASVSVSLPVSLSYTSASPPPSQTTDTLLTWRMDALSPQAEPELISLILLPADDALPATIARPTIAITSTTMELNTTNNQSIAWIFVGGEQWYLPLILHGAPRSAASPSRLLR